MRHFTFRILDHREKRKTMKSIGILALAVVVLVLCYCTDTANAIECYSCNSVLTKDCGDPFKAGGKSSSCKSCQKVKYEDIVVRTCSSISQKNACGEASYAGHTAQVCYCDKDRCNHGDYVSVSMATITCAGLLTMLARQLF